jgi:3-hydroxyacyl-[acyl-carrier-protein] dehydratase
MMEAFDHILDKLPYDRPFLFVQGLNRVDSEGVEGYHTFDPESYFYQGHFRGNPVTPGVILVECMAQIGLVCLGIHLMGQEKQRIKEGLIAMAHAEVDFLHAVLPGEQVTVRSEKVYFRFGKLKCKVWMTNSNGQLVCSGTLSGMMKIREE